MTDARYAELKRTLELRRLELQRTLDVKLRDVRLNHHDDGAPVGALDAAEASNSDLQQDIAIALAEMTAQLLERIDQALTRLANGSFGICVACNTEISLTRLTALPFAMRCRACEELHEAHERRSRPLAIARDNPFMMFATDSRN